MAEDRRVCWLGIAECCGRKEHNMATVRMRKKSDKWKWAWHDEYNFKLN